MAFPIRMRYSFLLTSAHQSQPIDARIHSHAKIVTRIRFTGKFTANAIKIKNEKWARAQLYNTEVLLTESVLFVCRFHFVTSFSSLVQAQQSKLKTYQFEVAKINERSTVPTDTD